MTVPHFHASQLRKTHPGWHIWRVGKRWWAKHKQSSTAVRADDPARLNERLAEQDRSAVEVPE
jgi:hypothetical protein